ARCARRSSSPPLGSRAGSDSPRAAAPSCITSASRGTGGGTTSSGTSPCWCHSAGGRTGRRRSPRPARPAPAGGRAGLRPRGRRLVGSAPGWVGGTKRWTVDGFAAVGAGLAAGGARCVVLGAADEAPLAEEVRARSGGRAVVLAGRTDLATLVAVIDRLALLVANDSAPVHVACARGGPRGARVCAPTPALGYGPWGHRGAAIAAELQEP